MEKIVDHSSSSAIIDERFLLVIDFDNQNRDLNSWAEATTEPVPSKLDCASFVPAVHSLHIDSCCFEVSFFWFCAAACSKTCRNFSPYYAESLTHPITTKPPSLAMSFAIGIEGTSTIVTGAAQILFGPTRLTRGCGPITARARGAPMARGCVLRYCLSEPPMQLKRA